MIPAWLLVLFGPLIVAAAVLSLALWLFAVALVVVSIGVGVLRLWDGMRGRR